MKYDIFLGIIAVTWPICWALWKYYQENKVRLCVTTFSCQHVPKEENKKIVEYVKFKIGLFNYGERPIGILEVWTKSNYDSNPIFIFDEEPGLIMPNKYSTFSYSFSIEGEVVKNIGFSLADNRKFFVKGRLIQFLNESIFKIGKENKFVLKVTKK